MRLVLRLHPDEYTTLRDDDRECIESMGYEIWCDPYGTIPGEALIMDIGPMLDERRRRWFAYDGTV